MRAAVRGMLDPSFEVLPDARDGVAAVASVLALDPDVLVLDVSMPGLDGFEVARQVRAAARPTRIVFLSVHEGAAFAREASRVGAVAYVPKSRMGRDLLPAVRRAAAQASSSQARGP